MKTTAVTSSFASPRTNGAAFSACSLSLISDIASAVSVFVLRLSLISRIHVLTLRLCEPL